MRHQSKISILSRWALALAATSAAGCLSDLQPLNVTTFYPLSTSSTAACVPATGISLVKGVYDVNRRGANGEIPGYLVGVEVASSLSSNVTQPNNDPQTTRIVSTTARLDTLTAKYTWSPAEKGTPAVTIADKAFPISAIVAPASKEAFTAQILPGTKEVNTALTKGKSGTLTVEIALSGTLSNGSTISSTPTTFAIGVCTDCVAECDSTEDLATPCGPTAAGQGDGRVCVKKTDSAAP